MSKIKVDSIEAVNATTPAITLNSTDGTCTANITNNLSNRNLIINGAMQVAQRGTSTTSNGYQTVDRFNVTDAGVDEATTKAQVDVASGTSPYTLGFRKALKITNGNQTSGAGADDYVQIFTRIEGQDLATSGWNYTSSSSFITLSFWIKSSVAQAFSGSLRSSDGTSQSFKFDTPSLSADTWTKVTKTILGNSNLTINNDNGIGMQVLLYAFIGTTYTTANSDTETWVTAGGNYANDMTSTWYTTNDATLEITGVQLEVGSHATDFEHRSFGQELALCQRYYVVIAHQNDSNQRSVCNMGQYSPSNAHGVIHFPVQMRTAPSFAATSGGGYYVAYGSNAGQGFDAFSLENNPTPLTAEVGTSVARTQGDSIFVRTNANGARMAFQAEL